MTKKFSQTRWMSQRQASHPFVSPYFVTTTKDPQSLFTWKKVDCLIKGAKGQTVFEMKAVEAPQDWSSLAVEIAASKYFRRPQERSIRKLIHRVVKAIQKSGVEQKYFNQKQSQIFANELTYILLSQKGSFNSPVWFNCGIFQSYKIENKSEHFVWNPKKKAAQQVFKAYENPQVSACFIQKIEDNLDSIFELVKNEAKIFKYGSGSGTNFSNLRSKYETLSGGGTSSGLISFLEVLDKGAGSIKSGGTTRRAAKMVCLDVDHPEILEFIEWKTKEEKKAQALIRQGYDSDFEGEAYKTVSGQNSNNSVRVSSQFLKAVEKNQIWKLRSRTTNKVIREIPAKQIWDAICDSAWFCADPGMQFDDEIQKWHTCSATDKIKASNPCSEYMFLDDSACNLASVNLVKFLKPDGSFDWAGYEQTAKVLLLAQDILVDFASYPTKAICENSHSFRPLGLGFAGLGSLLMRMAIPYDSDQGRAWASSLTAYLHSVATNTSVELAKKMGPFAGYRKNINSFQKVMKLHQAALKKVQWKFLPGDIKNKITTSLEQTLKTGNKFGYRNAQLTLMAPTGTIGIVMDCETTGIEPEFSLLKSKKMVGGGVVQTSALGLTSALKKLKYSEDEIEKITELVLAGNGLEGSALKPEHLPIFDCAQKNGKNGKRSLSSDGHLQMMAAIQPFLSGAISKTVNLPETATAKDISDVYMQAWKLGLKAVAIYRDNSKSSQPLNRVEEKIICPECGGATELAGGCFRCTNCGFTTGCVS